MAASTIYDVQLRFLMDDRATRGTRHLQENLGQANRQADGLSSALKRAGMAVAGYFGIQQGKRALIDFNSNMEQAKITMAGLLEQNMGGDFNRNMEKATALVGQLQQRAKASVGTTADMVQMASMLAQPISMAGGSMKELEDMTVGAVVGARAFGIAADVAARDVDQAIRGQYHVVDQFSSKILGPLGYAGEEGRHKFNQMAVDKRFSEYRRGLASKALQDMAHAQETSFGGVLSTLQDNIQMFLGKVGTPLFKEVTRQLREWNLWIDKNSEKIGEIGKTMSSGIMTAFKALKDITGWIYDHWKEIALYLGAKNIGGFVGGIRGGMAGGAGGATGAFGLLAARANLVVAAFEALIISANAFGMWMNSKNDEAARIGGGVTALRHGLPSLTEAKTMLDSGERWEQDDIRLREIGSKIYASFSKAGLADPEHMDAAAVQAALTESDFARKKYAGMLGVGGAGYNILEPQYQAAMVTSALEKFFGEFLGNPDLWAKNAVDGARKVSAEKPKINVTIHRIEVQSDDPDRFIFEMTTAVQRELKSRSSAFGTDREG